MRCNNETPPHPGISSTLQESQLDCENATKVGRYLRDPSFAGLDGKKSEHGIETVVVVKVLPSPDPEQKKVF